MPKTIKVKIAVAVDPKGEWAAAGWSDGGEPADEGTLINHTIEDVGPGELVYWVEAELPIPDLSVIKGDVFVAEK